MHQASRPDGVGAGTSAGRFGRPFEQLCGESPFFTLDRKVNHATDHFLHLGSRCRMVLSGSRAGARIASARREMADQGNPSCAGGWISGSPGHGCAETERVTLGR